MLLFKRIFVLSLALILSITPARAALGPDSIPAAFDELLKAASLSNPAMIIIDGTTGQVIYEKNIYSQRKPASVMKVLAAAVTLDYLDPQSVFNTTVSISPENKTIIIRGSLDPWISSDHSVARKMKRASLPYMGFNTLSAVKKANGGSLKNYKVIYSNLYSQDVANLNYMGFNTLSAVKKANGGSLKNYKVIYSNLYSQDVANLKAFWLKRGFKPTFKAVSDEETLVAQGDLIASENSPTVAEILKWMMLWSDNLLSERLARLSARAAGYSLDIKGVETIFRALLTQLEIDDSKLVVVDASGLSKKNRITAKLMGEFLYKIHKDETKMKSMHFYMTPYQ